MIEDHFRFRAVSGCRASLHYFLYREILSDASFAVACTNWSLDQISDQLRIVDAKHTSTCFAGCNGIVVVYQFVNPADVPQSKLQSEISSSLLLKKHNLQQYIV